MDNKAERRKKGKLHIRFLAGFALLIIVLEAAISILVATYFRGIMEDYCQKTAFDTATLGANAVDGDAIKEYVGYFHQFAMAYDENYASFMENEGQTGFDYFQTVPAIYRYVQSLKDQENNESYMELLEKFREYINSSEAFFGYRKSGKDLLHIKTTVEVKYCYIVFPDENQMFYIFDAGEPGQDGVCYFGTWENYYGDGHTVMRGAYHNPEERIMLITRDDVYGYGDLASAYVAIPDSDGNIVALSCVDISIDIINTQIARFVFIISGLSMVIFILFILAFFFVVQSRVLKPIEKLTEATGRIVEEQTNNNLAAFKVDVRTGDELEILGNAFTDMAHNLQENIDSLTRVTREKERIGAELDVAAHIQASMLPYTFPAYPERLDEFEIYATMDPAKEVGGDFYDFFLIDETHLAIVAADVSGKGVPASLFMAIGKTLLKDHTKKGSDPGDVFTEVNNLLCESNSEGLFITAFEGVLDLETGEFRYANAGHEMPFICHKDSEFEAVKVKAGFVLGGMEDIHYRTGVMYLEPGDCIFQYTDGVTEATDLQNQLFGMERLKKSLNRAVGKAPKDILAQVRTDIDLFVGEAPQFDDITMICLAYKQRRIR